MLENLIASSALPNLHPALVHFPLALLPLAVVCDVLAVLSARRWFDRTAVVLYGLGAGIGWWAAEVGEDAAEAFINLPAAIEPAIASHSDKAHYTLYAFGLVFALRLVFMLRDGREERLRARGLRAGVLAIAAVGLFFLIQTAEGGATLVYRQGLAVSPAALLFERSETDTPVAGSPLPEVPWAGAELDSEPSARLERGDDGSLSWTPVRRDGDALGSILFPLSGFAPGAVAAIQSDSIEPGLDLKVLDRGLLVFAPAYGDVRVEAELILDDFVGTVGVAHHAVSAEISSWFEISTSGGVALRLSQAGAVLTLEASELSVLPDAAAPDGSVRLAVSSTGRHRKGMVNGEAVVHGHIDAASEAGKVGLLFDGQGRVRVRRVKVEPLLTPQ